MPAYAAMQQTGVIGDQMLGALLCGVSTRDYGFWNAVAWRCLRTRSFDTFGQMDFAFSVFKLRNSRGYSLPFFNFGYMEKGKGTEWRFICGGTRAYMVRHATPLERDMDEQAADSHFMMRRITAELLLGGFGVSQAEPRGGRGTMRPVTMRIWQLSGGESSNGLWAGQKSTSSRRLQGRPQGRVALGVHRLRVHSPRS